MPKLLIDTDAGIDDLLAISYLITQPSVDIAAITVVNGLSHAPIGAVNILRLLQIVGREDLPVYIGAEHPLPGGTDFDPEWRKTADELPGVDLPSATALPKRDAVAFLAKQFVAEEPVTLLALGPHTNLAKALEQSKGVISGIRHMPMMGGAVFVQGNVGGTDPTAEWNIYGDPNAAASVFTSGMKISMVPLDATQDVPIDQTFLDQAAKFASPLGVAVSQLLVLGYQSNDEDYFAWDPLAAVSLVSPNVLQGKSQNIEIITTPPEVGRTKPVSGIGNLVHVATSASPSDFRKLFLGAFS